MVACFNPEWPSLIFRVAWFELGRSVHMPLLIGGQSHFPSKPGIVLPVKASDDLLFFHIINIPAAMTRMTSGMASSVDMMGNLDRFIGNFL